MESAPVEELIIRGHRPPLVICPNCFDDIPDRSPGCRHCGVNFAAWASGDDAPRKKSGGKAAAASAKGGRKGRERAAEPAREGWRFRPRRWAIGLTLLAVLGWLGFWGAGPALDRLSALGTVVFVSAADGNPELYSLSPGQRLPTRLTNHPGDDESPSLSSDGQRIAFVSSRDGAEAIYVMNADGARPAKLPLPPGRNTQPLWSPDGRALAFVSDADGIEGPAKSEVFAAAGDGSRAVNLSQSEAADAQPAWSPGGTRLAFVSDRDGHDRIYTVRSDGTELAPLTSRGAPEASPAFSPDGQRIAFVSEGEVYVAGLDGSAPRALTHGASETPPAAYAQPAWSPDSRRLAVFRSVQQGASRALELGVLGETGKLEAPSPAEPGGVAWLDGEHLVFLGRPTAGRSWFTIQRYSGSPQVCLRSLRRATQPWRPLDTLTAWTFGLIASAPAVDSSLTVLTETGAETLVWAPGSASRP
jgi:dipeptidyl aminopeptidase/acylaminoacyl peptidase